MMKTLSNAPRTLLLLTGLSFWLLLTNNLLAQEPQTYTCDNITQVSADTCQLLQSVYDTDSLYYGYYFDWDSYYDEYGGDVDPQLDSWFDSTTPCAWHGVTCTDGDVNGLIMKASSLTNNVVPQIAALPHVTALSFEDTPDIGSLANIPHLTSLRMFVDDEAILQRLDELPALTTLDIWSSNGISALPPEIGALSNLTTLELVGHDTLDIPAEISNLTNLEAIFIYATDTLTGSPDEIGNLPNLSSLSLTATPMNGSMLELLTAPNLTSVRLGDNLTDELFVQMTEMSNLANLTDLSIFLFSSELTTMPDTIRNFSNLQKLDIYMPELTVLPPVIGELSNLTLASFGSQKMTSLPSEIGNLSNLGTLRLDMPAMETLPIEIGNLTALTSLEIVYNSALSSLPEEIGNLSNLSKLSIATDTTNGSERPFDLPATVASLSGLTDVYVQAAVSEWPTSLDNWSNLTRLNVRDSVGNLPSLTSLTNLRELEIVSTDMTVLPDITGLNLTHLTVAANDSIFSPPDSYAEQNFPEIVHYHVDPLTSAIGCSDITEIPQNECLILQLLATDERNSDWFTTETPCSWTNLACEDGTITEIAVFVPVDLDVVFAQLPNLTALTLSGTVPDTIVNLEHLTELTLRGRYIELPEAVSELPNLTTLNLSRASIDAIPFPLPNISKLMFTDGDYILNPVPAWLTPDTFPNLTSLTFQGNSYRYAYDYADKVVLADEIGELSTLTELIIDDNRNLFGVPSSIVSLTELITLQITANNDLFTLPAAISEENFPNIVSFSVQSVETVQIVLEGSILLAGGVRDGVADVAIPYSHSGEDFTVYTRPTCDDATNTQLVIDLSQPDGTPVLAGTLFLPEDILLSTVLSDTISAPTTVVTDTNSVFQEMFAGTINMGELTDWMATQDTSTAHHSLIHPFDLYIVHDCSNNGDQQIKRIANIRLAVPTAVHLNTTQTVQYELPAALLTMIALLSLPTCIQLHRTRS